MGKPKVAMYWCASCGGCEEAVVDLAEDLLTVTDAVDIVFWPVAMDFKKSDVEGYDDNYIDACFINGAIRTDEQKEMVELLRRKSKLVFAFGSCAHIGGIPGLANFSNGEDILNKIYTKMVSTVNPNKSIPKPETKVKEGVLKIPAFHDSVKTLDQTIDVDYYIPGCAPPPDIIMDGINAILKGQLPEKGAVLAPDKSLCDSCHLNDSKPDKLTIKDIKRPHEVEHDPDTCFLAEGILCMGPATRSGCGERCINANMPCRGCFGPTPKVRDQGAKVLTAIASIVGIDDEEIAEEEEVEKILDKIVDPGGLFYMYSLPASILRKRFNEVKEGE